jgi:hypothetical protein
MDKARMDGGVEEPWVRILYPHRALRALQIGVFFQSDVIRYPA